jgi:hypothetical protein
MGIVQHDSPRHQLRFEELPRGVVKFPDFMTEWLEKEQARMGFRFSEEYARNTLELNTLIWYYDGLPVAYRSLPDGIEVLALGWAEVVPYQRNRQEGIKVMQT